MKKGYIQSINSVSEFQEAVEAMNRAGVDSNNIVINPSFNDFIKTVSAKDCIVVHNLDFFNSLAELIDITIKLTERKIHIKSISESWYNISPEMIDMLMGINAFGKRIRASHTRIGLLKAKAEGKILGRPVGSTKITGKLEAVTKLRKESKLSIAKACEMMKCNPRSYYRHLNKI